MQQFEQIRNRTKWFLSSRFGMFIHWGLYSQLGRGEWLLSNEEADEKKYSETINTFNPVKFDANKWADIALDAGMKYGVLTTKHHDGFCLFDSEFTQYKSTNTKMKKDFVAEYVNAFRSKGLKVGLYYSLLDWHNEDYFSENDCFHPLRNKADKINKKPSFDKYLKYMHSQIKELMTNYGKIDILWMDFSYDDFIGEKWAATELVKMIRHYQPDIILNSRLEGSGDKFGTIISDNPSFISGDFTNPEMIIPSKGIKTPSNKDVPWEACLTINNSWGYTPTDREYKSSEMLIKKLVECVSKGGNMILNVSPMANGEIPHEQIKILKEMGDWLKVNGESIYGATYSALPKPEWGRFTEKGEYLYAHILEENVGPICILDMKNKLEDPINISNGVKLVEIDSWIVKEFPNDYFISYDIEGFRTFIFPKTPDSVIRLKKK